MLTKKQIDEIISKFCDWAKVCEQENRPITAANIQHSSLLRWMLEGSEPFNEPPPLAFGYPWHQLLKDEYVEETEINLDHISENKLIICQTIWKIEENNQNHFVARYYIGHGDNKRLSKSRWIIVKHENTWDNKPGFSTKQAWIISKEK